MIQLIISLNPEISRISIEVGQGYFVLSTRGKNKSGKISKCLSSSQSTVIIKQHSTPHKSQLISNPISTQIISSSSLSSSLFQYLHNVKISQGRSLIFFTLIFSCFCHTVERESGLVQYRSFIFYIYSQ